MERRITGNAAAVVIFIGWAFSCDSSAVAVDPNPTFEEFAKSVEPKVRPLCECMMNTYIAKGKTPSDIDASNKEEVSGAVKACESQVVAISGASASSSTTTSLTSTSDAPGSRQGSPSNSAAWPGASKAAFIETCTQSVLRPAFKDYSIRGHVVAGLLAARVAQESVSDFYSKNGTLPTNLQDAGLSQGGRELSTDAVGSVEIAGGSIVVTFSNDVDSAIAGKTVTLTPYIDTEKDIIWTCGRGATPNDAIRIAANDSKKLLATSVENRFLPPSCRP
jgi:hypothetical protein